MLQYWTFVLVVDQKCSGVSSEGKRSINRCSKVHPRTGHKGPQWEWRYSSTHSSTLVLDGVGGQLHALAALPLGKTWYPLNRRLCGPQVPVWTVAENLAPYRDSIPHRPARSKSLYQLSYPGPYQQAQYYPFLVMSFWYHLILVTGCDMWQYSCCLF
jgi:hypothetical protein